MMMTAKSSYSPGTIQSATASKLAGNDFFSRRRYTDAITQYSKAIQSLKNTKNIDEMLLISVCHSNRAQCYLHTHQAQLALYDCEQALNADKDNIKASYRRALALESLSRIDEAIHQLRSLLRYQPGNQNVSSALARLIEHSRQYKHERSSAIAAAHALMNKSSSLSVVNSATTLLQLKNVAALFQHSIVQQCTVIDHGFCIWLWKQAHMFHSTSHVRCLTSIISNVTHHSVKHALKVSFVEPHLQSIVATLVEHTKSRAYSLFIGELIKLLSMVASGVENSKFLQTILLAFRSIIVDNSTSSSHSTLIISAMLMALSFIATNAPFTLVTIRTMFLKILLLSPLSTIDIIEKDLLHLLVKLLYPNEGDKKQSIDNTQVSNECEEIICSAFCNNEDDIKHSALIALVLLLQVNPQSTQRLVATQNVLSRIVEYAMYGSTRYKELATQVLAMSLTNTSVCQAIAEAKMGDIFFKALKSDKYVSRAFACVALAKLCSVDSSLRQLVLDDQQVLSTAIKILKENVSVFDTNAVHTALEAVLYLCVYVDTKISLAFDNDGDMIQSVLDLSSSSHYSVQYCIVEIMLSMVNSKDDMKRDLHLNSEKEQLRKISMQGLPNQDKQSQVDMAGTEQQIQPVRHSLVRKGAVNTLVQLHASPNKSDSKALDIASVKLLLRLSSITSSTIRGLLVQQGALKLLISLRNKYNERNQATLLYDASLAIARLCVSINPHLYSHQILQSLPIPLLALLDVSSHELHDYEALLAITNLASVSIHTRERLWSLNAWHKCMSVLAADNEQVQIACLEALTNMCNCNAGMKRLASSCGKQDLQIFLSFAKYTQCERAQMAALSGLAMMSYDEQVARALIALDAISVLTQLTTTHHHHVEIGKRLTVCVNNLNRMSTM